MVIDSGKHVFLDGAGALLKLQCKQCEMVVAASSHLCAKDVVLDGLKRSRGVLAYGIVRFEDVTFKDCFAPVTKKMRAVQVSIFVEL